MEKLKVGIIGCGGIAKLRLRQTEEEKENQSPMAQIRIHISEPTVHRLHSRMELLRRNSIDKNLDLCIFPLIKNRDLCKMSREDTFAKPFF